MSCHFQMYENLHSQSSVPPAVGVGVAAATVAPAAAGAAHSAQEIALLVATTLTKEHAANRYKGNKQVQMK